MKAMAPHTPAASLHLSRRDGEFLRVLASLSVVTAHCVHIWVERFAQSQRYLSLDSLAAIIDQFTRFTLPAFFFLSGFGLTLQIMDRPLKIGDYYRFRLFKIAAPFLLWSFITGFRHIAWIESWDWGQRPWHHLGSLARLLFIEGFDYQYYFLIVIFQFYLVFPFVFRLAKSRWAALAALVLHLAVTSPVETYLDWAGLALPPIHSNALVLNFFWCFMGMHLAWNREALTRWAHDWSKAGALVFWTGAFALINADFLINLGNGKALADIDHFNRWSVIVYSFACLLLFIKAKPWLTRNIIRHPNWDFVFTSLAPYTFFVYLAHTHVLRWVDFLYWERDLGDFLWRILAVLGGSYAMAWAVQWLLEDYPRLRSYFGLPSKSSRRQAMSSEALSKPSRSGDYANPGQRNPVLVREEV